MSSIAEGTTDVSKYTIPPFSKEDNPHGLASRSSFATVFPKYCEKYIRECFPLLTSKLKSYGINAELDLVEGTMTVSTTSAVWDPFIIMKARDILKLLTRSVPYEQAIKVLEDDVACDIIRISTMVSNPAYFVKRRQRLVGPNGSTLKAIELLTDCYVLVQGSTVAAIGPYSGLVKVRKLVENTMNNIHPIFHLKRLMIMRELEKNPELKNEDWGRFLPVFKKKNVKTKKTHFKKKKPYTPFPPPQTESKVDKELASGEYFLSEKQKLAKRKKEVTEKNVINSQQRQAEKLKSFIPPNEEDYAKKTQKSNDEKIDIAALKKKVNLFQKKKGLPRSEDKISKAQKPKKEIPGKKRKK